MRERGDPLVPVLGIVVSIVVIGTIGFIFVPRVSAWIGGGEESVVAPQPSPLAAVPVWVCRTEDGVALLIEPGRDAGTAAVLDAALEGGPWHYMQLTVCNFGREGGFDLELPSTGFLSPEGGENARPAAGLLRHDAPDHLKAVLHGLGAVTRLSVAKGHRGQALLVVPQDPRRRSAFAAGDLRFERRELARRTLAAWRQRPDWEAFKDF